MKEISEINHLSKTTPKVLVAPLDWGLGHATRCIPLINELLKAGFEVIIASYGTQKQLLQQEFPQLKFLDLKGYGIKYGRNGWKTAFALFLQIPKILIRIKKENRWLRHLSKNEGIDLVISDNRYGLHSPRVLSVFITHQLYIPTGLGKFSERMLQKINYRYINKFNVCWVPDRDRGKTLAGKLSHPFRFPNVSVEYIGLLSRFEKKELPITTIELLVVLSGPEPQRTIFEETVLRELTGFAGKCVLVRGLPNEKETGNFLVETYNHLPSDELNRLLCAADFVISRAGYSSIMDIIKLGKKSILVPTPGQPEQQFLAKHLAENSFAVSANQNDFSLASVLEIASQFNFKIPDYDDGLLLKSALSNLKKMMG